MQQLNWIARKDPQTLADTSPPIVFQILAKGVKFPFLYLLTDYAAHTKLYCIQRSSVNSEVYIFEEYFYIFGEVNDIIKRVYANFVADLGWCKQSLCEHFQSSSRWR